MLAVVPKVSRKIDGYRSYLGDEQFEQLVALAGPLRDCRVLQVSSLPSQAGLADTVNTLTTLFQDIGVVAESRTIYLDPRKLAVNLALNRAMNGHFVDWTPAMCDLWLGHEESIRNIVSQDYDFIIVHGPELAGAVEVSRRAAGGSVKWMWHCHSEVSKVQPDIWDFMMTQTRRYDRILVSGLEHAVENGQPSYVTVSPAIDPLTSRNRELPRALVDSVLSQYGVDPTRPVALFILRDDLDFGVTSRIVGGYRLAKGHVPDLQLLVLLAGDSLGQQAFLHSQHLYRTAGCSNDVRLVPLANGVGDLEINAFQQAAIALSAGSIDGDPALLLETMWKKCPVIVEPTSAAKLGIEGERNGILARSAEEYGEGIVRLCKSSLLAKAIGQAGRELVRGSFLITGLLRTYLTSMRELND